MSLLPWEELVVNPFRVATGDAITAAGDRVGRQADSGVRSWLRSPAIAMLSPSSSSATPS